MAKRVSYRVDFPEGAFTDVTREAERLGVDLGDLMAIAAGILVRVLADARREVRRSAQKGSKSGRTRSVASSRGGSPP